MKNNCWPFQNLEFHYYLFALENKNYNLVSNTENQYCGTMFIYTIQLSKKGIKPRLLNVHFIKSKIFYQNYKHFIFYMWLNRTNSRNTHSKYHFRIFNLEVCLIICQSPVLAVQSVSDMVEQQDKIFRKKRFNTINML